MRKSYTDGKMDYYRKTIHKTIRNIQSMKHCPNCEAKITEETKFCTNCGTSLQINSTKNDIEKNDDVLIEKSLNQPNKGLRIAKVLIGIAVLAVLFFLGKTFLPNDGQQTNLVGEWYDPTGVLLGDKETVITFRTRGDIVVGEDKSKKVFIQLLPMGSKNYSGLVVLNKIDDDFNVHFYEEENKLVFFSTLTKSSWYLIKLKN